MHDDDFEHEHYYEQGDPTEMALATGELVRLTTVLEEPQRLAQVVACL